MTIISIAGMEFTFIEGGASESAVRSATWSAWSAESAARSAESAEKK